MIDYYYSKFIIIETLKNLQASTVRNKCKKIFSQFETPKELVTNNGPEFTSHYFKLFLRTWHFEHRIISPHFHQSNGLVECAIQTVKHALIKPKLANEDHYLSMLFLNFQPNENGLSPALSYSIAQSALIYTLLNHNLNLLPLKQQLNEKPRID